MGRHVRAPSPPRPTRMRVLVVLLPVAAFTGLSLTAALGRDSVDVDETAFPWSSVGKIYNERTLIVFGCLDSSGQGYEGLRHAALISATLVASNRSISSVRSASGKAAGWSRERRG